MQPKLLIEIAIINFASPTHTDGVAAHQPIDRGRIECVDYHLHVFVELAVVPQVSGETADGKIGNAVKLIKHYAEVREELAFESGLHLGLRPGQERSDGVINQMQRKIDSLAIP